MGRNLLPSASAYTAPGYLGGEGDASPHADIDRLATGTSRRAVSLKADAFSSATAPMGTVTDTDRIAANAISNLPADGVGSMLSRAFHNASGLVSSIPIIGPAISAALNPTAQAAPAPQVVYQQAAAPAAAPAPSGIDQKTLLYVGGGLAAVAFLALAMRRK